MSDPEPRQDAPKGKTKKRLLSLLVLASVGLVLSITLMSGGTDRPTADHRQAPEAISQSGIRVVELITPRSPSISSHGDSSKSRAFKPCIVCHGGIYHGR